MGKHTARCSICMSKMFKSSMTSFECCKLLFCASCAYEVVKSSNPRCPGCRADLISEERFCKLTTHYISGYKRTKDYRYAVTLLQQLTCDNRRLALTRRFYDRDMYDIIHVAAKTSTECAELIKRIIVQPSGSSSRAPPLLLS